MPPPQWRFFKPCGDTCPLPPRSLQQFRQQVTLRALAKYCLRSRVCNKLHSREFDIEETGQALPLGASINLQNENETAKIRKMRHDFSFAHFPCEQKQLHIQVHTPQSNFPAAGNGQGHLCHARVATHL